MMIQMQKSQQWSFSNVQTQIEDLEKKMQKNKEEDESKRQEMSAKLDRVVHSLSTSAAIQSYMNQPQQFFATSKTRGLNCSNAMYC